MPHVETNPQLQMQWTSVTDEAGRDRLEVRWVMVDRATTSPRRAA